MAVPSYSQYYSNDITPPVAVSGKLQGASQGKQVGGGINSRAYLMSGNALTAIDLHPATGYYNSMATSTDGTDQCGYAASNLGGIHASKWSGSSSSHVDLHPSGYNFSYCTAVDNGQQGGFAEQQSYFISASHAMLWNGSSIATDLHPLGYTFSRVMGLKGGEQVGYASTVAYPYGDYPNGYHSTSKALRWNGSAASVVVLHPLGYDASEALATNGLQQAGWSYRIVDGGRHATLWSGTSTSAIDMHPAGYNDTAVTAITATQQVGEGWVGIPGGLGSVRHALLWTGSATGVVDLNQYLPVGYKNAIATGIDANGNVVGFAYNTPGYGLTVPADSIAVVFAPGVAPVSSISSITLSPSNVAPGSTIQATVTLGVAAPAGGLTLNFASTNLALLATPASVVVPEGLSSATLTLPILGSTLTAPAVAKLFAGDGVSSRNALLTVTPVVRLASVTVNPTEGGLTTYGTVNLNIPAQFGGAVVSLTSSNPAVLAVPASVTILQGSTYIVMQPTTSTVTAITPVTVTATFNGASVTATVSVNAAPVVAVSSIAGSSVVGGQTINGTIQLSNYVRDPVGARITLTSSDPAVQLPATVLVPQGWAAASFTASTLVVPAVKSVSITGAFNGSQATATVVLDPIPTVTILLADYKPATLLLNVNATTTYANSIMTYGSNGVAFGTMQFKLGIFSGSILIPSNPPATITVWNSNGGQASAPVTISISGGTGGGGTGGGGGGGTATGPFKLTTSKTGKGTVTANPAAATYASGTVVTLTAVPDPGSPWVGWAGACTGTATTCTLTMNSDKSVTANFK